MASGVQEVSVDVVRSAKSRQLGACMSVHKVGSVYLTVTIAVATAAGLYTILVLVAAIGATNLLTSTAICLGLLLVPVLLFAGLAHRGEEVYLYSDGLVFVDRTSVTAVRFDEVQLLKKIDRKSPEAMLGRASYRIVGGGYSIRVSGLVKNSREFGQRLEDAIRRHGGLIK
jgi:hypothetical protein